MKELTLTLTIDETNLVLNALGSAPFNKVSGLIEKLRSQAQPQVTDVTGVGEVAETAEKPAMEVVKED